MTAKQLMSLGAGLERMKCRLDKDERWAYYVLTNNDRWWAKYVDTDEGRAE